MLNPAAMPGTSPEEVLVFLKKRKGILEGVCITGGEPTLQPDLKEFIMSARELGYLIKLDTNGYRPDILRNLMEEGLLDYVAMDVKASKANYEKVAGCREFEISRIEESVAMLMGQDKIPYEFRTTVVKGLHDPKEFEELGKWLSGARVLYLQSYLESANVLNPSIPMSDFTKQELESMADMARNYIARVEIRGVE